MFPFHGDPSFVPGKREMKITALAIIFISIIAIGLASRVYSYFTNTHVFGSWWASLLAIIFSFVVLTVATRENIAVSMLCSIVLVIIVGIGASIDAAGATFFNSVLKACVENGTGGLSGHSQYYTNATFCYSLKSSSQPPQTYDCYCTDTNYHCYYYDGQPKCSLIFTELAPLMSATAWFEAFTFFTVLTLSIISCCAVCCPNNFKEPTLPPLGTHAVTGGIPLSHLGREHSGLYDYGYGNGHGGPTVVSIHTHPHAEASIGNKNTMAYPVANAQPYLYPDNNDSSGSHAITPTIVQGRIV